MEEVGMATHGDGRDGGPIIPDARAFARVALPDADPPPDPMTLLPDPLFGDPANLFRVSVPADSLVRDGSAGLCRDRLTTFKVTAPRCVLAEINTHRALSRSSESSRAIPAKLRIQQVELSPYRPLALGRRTRGMGAGDPLSDPDARVSSAAWEYAKAHVLIAAKAMEERGLAKEELNRVLEPWALCRTVITATDWDNFFALRTHGAAHPVFRFLARAMYVAYRRSVPRPLDYGEWHLPFVLPADREAAAEYCRRSGGAEGGPRGGRPNDHFRSWEDYHLCRWSTARCARVSFGLHGGDRANPAADDITWAKLVGKDGRVREAVTTPPAELGIDRIDPDSPYEPLHASPLEHQGTPLHPLHGAANPRLNGNLNGWVQFRKLFRGECVRAFAVSQPTVDDWAAQIPDAVFGDAEIY